MNSFFTFLLLLSVIAFIISLIKPSLLKLSSRKQSVGIFGIAIIILFVLIGATAKKPVSAVVEEVPKVTETKPTESVPVTPNPNTPDRESILNLLKTTAKAKWGDNYQMVKYEYDNQVEAYDWVVSQTAYPEIMAKAKSKCGNNYQMVKYEYENQVKAFKSL
jgi:hypothetical protein